MSVLNNPLQLYSKLEQLDGFTPVLDIAESGPESFYRLLELPTWQYTAKRRCAAAITLTKRKSYGWVKSA
jgi:hypothetical protein